MRNAIVLGWKGSIPGRELAASRHLAELGSYLAKLSQEGCIGSFETFVLDPHGHCHGFVVVRGNAAQLDLLQNHEAWTDHLIRAGFHLEGVFAVRATAGDEATRMMERWEKLLPK